MTEPNKDAAQYPIWNSEEDRKRRLLEALVEQRAISEDPESEFVSPEDPLAYYSAAPIRQGIPEYEYYKTTGSIPVGEDSWMVPKTKENIYTGLEDKAQNVMRAVNLQKTSYDPESLDPPLVPIVGGEKYEFPPEPSAEEIATAIAADMPAVREESEMPPISTEYYQQYATPRPGMAEAMPLTRERFIWSLAAPSKRSPEAPPPLNVKPLEFASNKDAPKGSRGKKRSRRRGRRRR